MSLEANPTESMFFPHTCRFRLSFAATCCCLLLFLSTSSDAAAQDDLRLTATSQQGAVAAYSAPVDIRNHSVLRDRSAGADLSSIRIAGSVRNSGDTPVRLAVFAVPERTYRSLATSRGRAVRNAHAQFLALFYINIGPSTIVNLGDHAPEDPAALQAMLAAGPVRFGLQAESADLGGTVNIQAIQGGPSNERLRTGDRFVPDSPDPGAWHPLEPFVQSRRGAVSLRDGAPSRSANSFLENARVHPGDTLYPSVSGAW